MARNRQNQQLRQRVAVEAARLISETGQRDFHVAKRKAAQRLGIGDEILLPSNQEIDAALREHQSLFQPGQGHLLQDLRTAAAEAMRFFARFQPRLVGAVLDGSADAHSAISLHLFTQSGTDVTVFLIEQGIDFTEGTRNLRYGPDDIREVPMLRFAADGHAYDFSVLDIDDLRQSPLDRVSGVPMRRLSRNGVLAMLEQNDNPT